RLLSDRSGGKEALGALGRAAEYVEAVADAHVLQVAEPGVEGDQGLIGRLAVGGAFLDEAALFSPLENERRNDPRAARIKRLRLGELVEQAFELERGPVRSGGGQRRRHVSDRHRADAALGLRRLARIVDDERIDDRGRADEHFRGAALAERNRLARQPFQRAMRAELNDCVDFFAAGEPEVEGDVAVPRRQVEIVIVALARRRGAAVGLDSDDELAELNEAEGEGATDRVAVMRWLAPGGEQRLPEGERGRGELGFVFAKRQRRLERSILEGGDERRRVKPLGYVISRRAQGPRDGDGARRRIQADRIAGPSAARRVVRQHAGQALVGGRLSSETGPAAGELGGEVDAVGERPVRDCGELGLWVPRVRRLEGYGAGKDSPVDLGQRDMHREVRWAEPPLRGAPRVEANARQRHLQHW